MPAVRKRLVQEAASRGKYAPLYRRLLKTPGPNWRVSFSELEAILGFNLPNSARLYRPWWSNQKHGAGHSHALAWSAAGWKTRFVDLEAETLVFERIQASTGTAEITADSGGRIARRRKFDLDALWPAIHGGSWPQGFTVSREQIYDESGRLTGGPQDEPAQEA